MAQEKEVDVGAASARAYWVSTVDPTYYEFVQHQSRENALNAMKVLWEMADWFWREQQRRGRGSNAQKEMFIGALVSTCPELSYIRDVVESLKHGGRLGGPGVKISAFKGAGSPGGVATVTTPYGAQQFVPESHLRFECSDGSVHPAANVLDIVKRFWQRKLEHS